MLWVFSGCSPEYVFPVVQQPSLVRDLCSAHNLCVSLPLQCRGGWGGGKLVGDQVAPAVTSSPGTVESWCGLSYCTYPLPHPHGPMEYSAVACEPIYASRRWDRHEYAGFCNFFVRCQAPS